MYVWVDGVHFNVRLEDDRLCTLSILRFVEDSFGLPRIGGGSFDAQANSLNNMFDFSNPNPWKVLLDPNTGMVM